MGRINYPEGIQRNRFSQNSWNPLAHASLYSKLLISLFLVFSVTILAVTYQLEKNIEERHIELLKDELRSLAAIAAVTINGDIVDSLREPEQQTTGTYRTLKESLTRFMAANRNIQDIYIMRKGPTADQLFFVVDADPEEPAPFGELYDAKTAPDMVDAFQQPAVDREFVTDKWGVTLSGYAPVKNSYGESVAIVGIDFDANSLRAGIGQRREQMLLYTVLSMALMLLISLVLATSIVRRLNRVKRAVDIILESDSQTEQIYRGKDEVNLLASRVNNLIEKVAVEKEQILTSIIMALVNTLEVRDRYTHGHSAEVAAIATDIMNKLSLSDTEKFTINFAALLHDIGKIGIADTILNKTGKLTEEEFAIIKRHPAIGAKILEGIPSMNQISQIIKHHHERYDGKGYPDKLTGRDILLGARIIAVADSFQAMISDRTYRQGMSQAEAMEELARNKGTQFDTDIVEVFLDICKTKQYKTDNIRA
ncbi:HD-GYP domain-containing protein [Sporomusa acidovorans]|uniref:Cyclic di-GMP phosphodiesterase response regulator RpfG n=1 Tax=Sporomusa acidovorans (strain ATCC 49682 / DSM 3132 / Mol) TaxID=1123286 RepID=A0ABZ3IVM3_SPOA4|nr:HD-GYP domain-containing protein [Sporomusa acidovorans]OZC17997.1 cyclic di-GMP phosphodiesterase response regulator RpfG [Sporomusa acidovorans DSM 3132]SDF42428.1 HDIG domain-containing protein [Sporomusa acidovorans]